MIAFWHYADNQNSQLAAAKLQGRIPAEIRDRFDAVGRFDRMVLLQERPG
jgi:hypothetical protein